MAATGNRGGGQRSKGPRSFVGTRVPVDEAQLLPHVAKLNGLTVSEFVAAIIHEKLAQADLSSLEWQEALPLEVQERVPMRRLAS